MANDVYNNKSGSSLQDAYARLNEAIKQRNASLNGQQYDTTNGVALNTTPVGVNGQQQAQAQGSDANWAWRTIGTIDEALRNVGRGFLKLGEGVVDAHLAIGGIFDKEWAENVIKYDAVNAMMEWESNNFSLNSLYKQKTGSNLYDESWLNDANNKVQNIVQGVEQGIGNALGFMALSQVPYAGIGLTWSGSGGMVLEEQFNDPNYNGNYYGAWGGAFLQGGVETGLEYLLGWSPKKTGVSAKTFKTILKDLGKDFAEEGLEEVASDLINPLFEGMYTDKTLAESYDDVTIESLGETFLVGGLTGALMSGAGEVSSTIYLSPEGQKIAYEINENNEYYKQAYENFKNNPNEQEAYDNFIKVRDEVATNLKALGERVGKLASKYQNRLGTTATINGQKVQLPMTQEVLNEQADITSKANPVIMAVQETIDLMNNSNIKGIDNMKVEFVTEGSEAYKKAFKTNAKGINGAYDKNTNTFYLNTNSAKAFKFVTGHEITHLMEENGAYEDVYDEILDSLEQSGEYDKLYEKTSKLYEDQIKGMSKEQARKYINQEIVADYFGENFKNFSEIQKLFTKQSTWEKFKDLIKSVRKSNRSSKAKDYYQRFLKEAVNTKIEEKEQPTKAVAYSKSGKVFKFPEWYKEKLRKGIRLKDSEFVTLDIKKLIEDNSLMTGSTTSLRNDVWGEKESDYTFDENKIQEWWYAPIIVENKDGKYKIQDGRHRVIALYNAGYSKIEVVMYEPRTRFSKSSNEVDIELENPNRDSYIKAKKEFGTTYRINLAGWLNVDGSMLDFSDGQGYRVQDHREIQNIYKDNKWTDALIQYLAEGNIRLQSYGFEIWRKPTQQQIEVLKRHIKNNYGEVVVDIDYNKNGDTKTFEYERGTPTSKIIEDINNYFDNGVEPIIDKANDFKYSKSVDSEGNNLSEQQFRFFKDSIVRDENGNLMVVYHGSKNVGFNTFDINKYGESGHPEKAIFFTNSKKFADNFKGKNGETREFYLNIKKPLDLNNLNEKEIEMLANMQDFGLPLEENKKHIKEYIEAKNYYALKMYVDYSKAQKLGYDGVIVSASNSTIEYAVFNSKQIKSIENKNPTSNPDIRYSIGGGLTTTSNTPAMFVDSTNYTNLDDIELISLLSSEMLKELQGANITFTANGRKVIVALRTIARQTYKDSAGFKREVKALVRQWFGSIRVEGKELHTFFDMDKNSTEFKDYVTEMVNQTTNDFLNNVSNDIKEREKMINTMISTTINSFTNQIKSLKELSTRSRKATIKISNLKYWAKTAIDGDAIYAKHKLESVFQASAKTIADLQFSPTTAKVDKSYGAVIQNLKKFYDDSRTTEFKNKEQAVQDYIEEAFKYFEQRYNTNGQQFKPLETLDTINDTNYPLLEGKIEVEVYADVLREMRRIINASTKITYAELNGQQVVARDVAREELDRQTNIDRKVARNFFTKGANSYMLSLVDTKTYMVIMAHADNESLMMKIYQELFEGQKETYRIQRELFKGLDKFLEDKNNKKLVNRLNKKKYNVKFKGVELSLNEAISLYMLMGTDNAPSHLIGDGVELETKDVGKVRRILGKDFLSFATEQTQKELAMIKSIKNTSIRKGQQLTQEQLDYLQRQFGVNKKSHADLDGRLSKLYEETLKIARSEVKKLIGNEYNEFISVLEKLYKDAGVYYAEGSEKILGLSYAPKDYYYPTKNVKSALKDTDALTSFVNNSLNPSFTKKVKGGSNALYVGGVLETTRGFVNTLSKYCGVTVAVKNVNKFLNAEVKMANGEKYTIADYLSKNVDLKFTDKMNDLFNAMQGIEVKQNSHVDKALRKFRSFASKSALGANLKSTIVQFSSYPKAYMYLEPTNLSKAFKGKKARAKDGLVDFDYAMKESAFIANRYRDGNIYNIESVGAFKEVDKFTDWLMKPMEFTDKLVLERIWYACQYECMDSNGKVDFKKAIALFEQVVSDTQAQYDALGNGAITRINNEIMKGALMYSSENRKTLSRIVEAIYMVAVTDKNSPEHKKAVKFLGRVSASFIAQSAFVMAVSILLKALKGDYDDEEAEEIVLGIVKDEFATNFVGMFPIIKDIYSVLVQGYDYKVSGVAQAVDLLNAFKDLPTLFDVEASDGERRSAFLQSVTTIAQFFGIPVRNLINDVLYPLGFVDKHFDTNMVMKMKNFFYNTSNSSLNTYLKTYAKRGKEEQVAGTIQMKFRNYISGDIDDVSAKELARLYMNGSLESFPTQLSSSVYVDGVEYTLNKAQKSHAKEIYAIANELLLEMIKSSVYATLSDEEKAYAISKLYGTYYELIKQMVVSDYKGTKLSQVANYVDVTKYASILAKIGGMKATTKQTRKVVVQNYINKQKMSSSEKYLLYYLAGYSLDDEKKKLVQNYLKTKGMSYKQAKEFVQPAQNNEKEDK